MSIDPKTVPIGAAVHSLANGLHYRHRNCGPEGIERVFVPVPEGMTYADAEAALADAGAWVEVADIPDVPMNARYRYERRKGLSEPKRYLVHRDDLPPTDPDADLIEALLDEWVGPNMAPDAKARRLIAIVREHEAKS